jgi:hypothetical protein
MNLGDWLLVVGYWLLVPVASRSKYGARVQAQRGVDAEVAEVKCGSRLATRVRR